MKKFMALLVAFGVCGVCLAPVIGCGEAKKDEKKADEKKADEKKADEKKAE